MPEPRHIAANQSYRGTPPVPVGRHAPPIQAIESTRRGLPPLVQDVRPSAEQAPFPARRILGVTVRVCAQDQAIDFLLRRLNQRVPTKLAFANMHLLSQISVVGFPAWVLDDFVVLNDGVGLDIASYLLYGAAFPDNLNGTDLVPAFLAAAGKETRVFLYGGGPQIVERAAKILPELCGVTICGTCDGFGVTTEPGTVPQRIRDAAADIVLVALGNPNQEMWIAENASALGAPLVIGVGALFDIVTRAYPRAPAWIRRSRLEWLYRMALEPSRLWNRYTIEAVSFFYKLLRDR